MAKRGVTWYQSTCLVLSTANRSTHRLGGAERVELSSTTGVFKRLAPRRGAGDTSQARVDGFVWVKKPSGICSRRDDYYIGPNYEVTGPKVRPTGRRPERTGARAFVQVEAGVGALVLH